MTEAGAFLESLFRNRKQVSFAEYVNAVLHHPKFGYYGKYGGKDGIERDFYTAPVLTSAFGRCVSNFISSAMRFFPDCKSLSILDAGAGNGALLADMALHIREDESLKRKISFTAVEQNFLSGEKIKKRFSSIKRTMAHYEKIEDISPFSGVAVFNEFFDALPFSRVKIDGGKAEEIYVEYADGILNETSDVPSSESVINILSRWFSNISGSGEVDVCPVFEDVLKVLSEKMEKGFVLIIDYGNSSERLFSNVSPQGTMRCFNRHKVNSNPYHLPGEQDITFSVNFSEIAFQSAKHGFKVLELSTLYSFLVRWGILDIVSSLAVDGDIDIKKYNEIQKIKNLLLPGAMGEIFKVMLIGKGLSDSSLFFNGGVYQRSR